MNKGKESIFFLWVIYRAIPIVFFYYYNLWLNIVKKKSKFVNFLLRHNDSLLARKTNYLVSKLFGVKGKIK